jgi:hypothetical protein
VRAKAAQQGMRHRAGVGLESDAVRPEVGDDGRGPPVSLRGAAVHNRPSWAAVGWAALGRKAMLGCRRRWAAKLVGWIRGEGKRGKEGWFSI